MLVWMCFKFLKSVQWQLSVCFLPTIWLRLETLKCWRRAMLNSEIHQTNKVYHLSSSFENISYHHVLVWPNWIMLSSFCQRLCKSTWGGVLILIPQGFIKHTFYQITFYNSCQDLFSNETWNNTNATATLFTIILLSHMFSHVKHFPISQWYFNVLHYQLVLSFLFWPPYNVFLC